MTQTKISANQLDLTKGDVNIDCGVLIPPFVNLLVDVTGDKANYIDTFTINNHTYTISDFTVVETSTSFGPQYESTLEISVPTNVNLPWEMTSATVKGYPEPSSGTLNLTDDYTLSIIFNME